MSETNLTQLHLDVYDTRRGPWNPDHGEVEIPDNWEFLPSGDAFVTRRVKAAGEYWVVWRPRSRNRPHRRRLGLWAPGEAIEAAGAEAAQTEQERARRREQSVRARDRQESRYREQLADAIRQFLAFAPQQTKLADEIAAGAAAVAAQVGTGRVGRTKTIPVSERAALAARAYIRHRYTSYESELPDPTLEDGWDDELLYGQVKAEAQVAVDEFLERHRRARA